MTTPSHIVSLTFDDALDVHLDVAVPLMEKYGFRGSFYVPLGAGSFTRRLDDWRHAATRGHELGNHTIFHPAWRHKSYVTEGNDIERYTLDRMRVEIETANRILTGLDGREERSFAYPCCNSVLGHPGLAKRSLRWLGLNRTRLMGWILRHSWLDVGSTELAYESVVAQHCVAARSGGDRFAAGVDYPPSRWSVPCVSLDGKQEGEVRGGVDEFLGHDRGWLVYMVHGVGGGHRLSCDTSVLELLLKVLQLRGVTVLPFRDAVRTIYQG